MSRTDKDRPWWLAATWWEPHHFDCTEPAAYGRPGTKVCDLPDTPRIKDYHGLTRCWRQCYWRPRWERRHYPSPSRDSRRVLWHGPQRRAARDDCRIAMQQHRGGGRVDIDPTVAQARNGISAWW